MRSDSPLRFVPLLAFAAFLVSPAQAQGRHPARHPALAYTPGAIWSQGDIPGRLGVATDAIYLIDRTARPVGGGRVLGDPKSYRAYDAKISPRGDLVAFLGAPATRSWRAGDGVGVLDSDGELITYIPGGATFAWSPKGTRLAVVLPGEGRTRSSAGGGMVLWNRRDRSARTIWFFPSRVGWAGEDSLLLQLGDHVEALDPRSGVSARTGHHGTVVSPDGLYSIWPGEGGRNTRIIEDETNRDVTRRLYAPVERRGLHEIRSIFWIQGGGSDHFMCVSGSDHVYGESPRCITAIVDAATGEAIPEFPGEAIGPTGDGTMTVVLRHETDRLETVDLAGLVRRRLQGGDYY
jgi:hypothetical protein